MARSFRPSHKGSYAPRYKGKRPSSLRAAPVAHNAHWDRLAELIGLRDACARAAAIARTHATSARRTGDHEAADDHIADAEAEEAELARLNTVIVGLGGVAR